MRETHINVNADRPNLPLAQLVVGVNCAAAAVVKGLVPRDVEAVAVEIERTPDGGTPRPNFSVNATRLDDGGFAVYFPPFCFPDVTDGLHYHVIGTDGHSNTRYLGSGQLRVLDCPAGQPHIPPPTGAQGVFFPSEVIDGVQHYKRQDIRFDADMGAWGAEWTGDFVYTPGGFIPYEEN